MKIGLIVEGKSDVETIQRLVEGIYAGTRKKPGTVVRQLRQGNMLKPDKIRGLVNQMISDKPGIKKIIICLDCECTREEEKQPKIKKAEKELQRMGLNPLPRYCLVVHALESWLATDSRALGSYLGKKIQLGWNPVSACHPKDCLKETFKREGRTFDNIKDNPRLAQSVNIQTLTEQNPSFAQFRKLIETHYS